MRILGISAYYHDSAAALVQDGDILAAAQEERFSRKKHDARFPRNAVRYCLEQAGVALSDVDYAVFYDKPFLKFERLLETYLALAPRGFTSFRMAIPVWLREKLFLKDLLRKELGAFGNTTLRLYHYEIEDLVDIVPIGIDGESPGNIPKARRQGLEWKSTLQLGALGIKGAKLDVSVELEKSRVRDPLTGAMRPISETMNRELELNFRHDIPGSQIAYGFDFETYHIQDNYRLREVGLNWEGPTWLGLYVEHKDVFGLTVRGSVNNVLNARNRFDRTVYEGYRDRTPVAFIEHRNRLIGPIFSLRVAGSF